jgi:Tfp pilus assembly pilus retraction ATPase PilT
MSELLIAPEPGMARHRLSRCLRAVVAQRRLHRVFGTGFIVVPEILLNTAWVATAIREGKPAEILGAMRRGRGLGMCTLDDSLRDALEQKMITPEDAYAVAEDKVRFEPLLRPGTASRRG